MRFIAHAHISQLTFWYAVHTHTHTHARLSIECIQHAPQCNNHVRKYKTTRKCMQVKILSLFASFVLSLSLSLSCLFVAAALLTSSCEYIYHMRLSHMNTVKNSKTKVNENLRVCALRTSLYVNYCLMWIQTCLPHLKLHKENITQCNVCSSSSSTKKKESREKRNCTHKTVVARILIIIIS